VALVVGASRGIGRAIKGLAQASVSIALCSRTEADLLQAAQEIRAVVVRAEPFPAPPSPPRFTTVCRWAGAVIQPTSLELLFSLRRRQATISPDKQSLSTAAIGPRELSRENLEERRPRKEFAMLIVDSQIHIWQNGLPPNPYHRPITPGDDGITARQIMYQKFFIGRL